MIGFVAHPKNMIALCDRDGGKWFVIHLAMDIGTNTIEKRCLNILGPRLHPSSLYL